MTSAKLRSSLGLLLGVLGVLALVSAVAASGGCKLSATTRDGFAFDIRGNGFAAGEEVTFRFGLVQNEPWEISKRANRHGSFWEGLYFESTTPSGVYLLTAEAASCSARTTIAWPLPDTATAATERSPGFLSWRLWLVLAAGLIAFSATLKLRLFGNANSERS